MYVVVGGDRCAEFFGVNDLFRLDRHLVAEYGEYWGGPWMDLLVVQERGTLLPGDNTVTVHLGNKQMAFTNHYNVCQASQHLGLMEMKTFYIGLNQVISGTYRSGSGLCSMCLTWYDSWDDLPSRDNWW